MSEDDKILTQGVILGTRTGIKLEYTYDSDTLFHHQSTRAIILGLLITSLSKPS